MKIIGGEQAIEFEHIVDLGHAMIEKGQSRLFYSLGRSALAAILENEISHGNNSILLPDYLCESITNTVISLGMEYSFYHIKRDLQPDLDSINRQINKKQIILLINYFGVISVKDEVEYLKSSNSDVTLIVDNVQSFFDMGSYKLAEYEFTSFRKWFPIPDGAEVITHKKAKLKEYNEKNEFSKYKVLGNVLKTIDATGAEELGLSMIDTGEQMIDKNYRVAFSDVGKSILSHIDYDFVLKRRRDNAMILCDGLDEMGINYICNNEIVPLFVPIFFEEKERNFIRKKLFENNIFCPVHWPFVSSEISGENELYHKELSLVCDQRYTPEDMHRILEVLSRASAMYK